MAKISHQDIELGMDVLVTPSRPQTSASGWFRARVLKRYSRGIEARYLEGPLKDRELAIDYSRVKLLEEAPRNPPPIEITRKPNAREELLLRPPIAEPIPEPQQDETENIGEQVDAWLSMGRELTAPLEAKVKIIDDEIAFLNGLVVELEEKRVELGKERERVATQLTRLRKMTGQ